ncbi:hypothetical protein [Legionella spiritensis]|uniref:hypothetical protein n=1 Tax=Legionella spiritensis TaxID=452 RepID=UPI000F6CBA35|nr:hypothetical protein [Legionella spiritensis]VEG91556.1 Uncharacterised protein [Legionella spiritensis]
MREGYHRVKYRPMPNHARFGLSSRLFHNEACYTAKELALRSLILSTRAASGMAQELLQTDNRWFDDDETAFINVNEGSWIWNSELKPRFELGRDDFHIGLQTKRKVVWTQLYTMTRTFGDYLLKRNSLLSDAYLNQPMNYFLLDIVHILNRLAVISDGHYVNEQLRLLRKYIRTVEIHIPADVGSDRLFLADCRRTIESDVQTEIENKLQSRQLKDNFERLQQQLTRLAELRHTGLHFALTANSVNPHPYWEHFDSRPELRDNPHKEFPTLAAKRCAKPLTDALAETLTTHESTMRPDILELDETILEDCADFKFIDNLPKALRKAYSESLVNLQEISRFQRIIEQVLLLFDQGGEVFTFIQFREQMQMLLQSIEQFVHYSQASIVEVMEGNTRAYHQYLQEKQDLRWWEPWLSNKAEKIDVFISNQDNLARYQVSPGDLQEASNELLQTISDLDSHLSQHTGQTGQQAMLTSLQASVQQLMSAMDAWVGHQYLLRGLSPPAKSDVFLPREEDIGEKIDVQKPIPVESGMRGFNPEKPEMLHPELCTSSAARISPPITFWSPPPSPFKSIPSPCDVMLPGSSSTGCEYPQIGNSDNARNITLTPAPNHFNAGMTLGILILLPLGLLILKLLYDAWTTQAAARTEHEPQGDPETFDKLVRNIEDLLAEAWHLTDNKDTDLGQSLQDFQNDLLELKMAAINRKSNNILKAQELFNDIDYFIKDIQEDQYTFTTQAP